MEDLKKCPFCGKSVEPKHEKLHIFSDEVWFIECCMIGCEIHYQTLEELTEAWNRRAK